MASKKSTTTTQKKAPLRSTSPKKAAKKGASAKKAGKKTPSAKKATKKDARKGTTAAKQDAEKTIVATITLTGEPAELKAYVDEIVEEAKVVIEKEVRKQIRQC